jgi:signal transduction histidine kinase
MLELIGDPALTVERSGRITGFNQPASLLLGLTDGHLGESVFPFLARLGETISSEDLQELAASGTPAVLNSGAELEGAGELILDVRGAVDTLILRFTDQESDAARDRRLQAENARLETANEVLREFNAERARILNLIAHELRNPLVTIRGYIEMIARHRLGPLTDQQERGLTVALRNTIALADQIDMLVEYSRIEGNTIRYSMAPTDLGGLVHKACGTMVELAKRSGLTLQTALPAGRDVQIIADQDKLLSVIRVLLDNAIKFTARGGIRVQVKLVEDEGQEHAEVNVIDSGCGIDPAHHATVFEPFTQVPDSSGGRGKGTGLGLYVASVLVSAHSSKLRCDSRPSEGSRFWFRLPLFSVKVS